MRVKTLIVGISAFVMCVTPAFAGQPDPKPAAPTDNTVATQQPQDCRNAGATLVKLGHFVDLWRDANLNDETGRAKEYEMEMTDMLRNDIRQCMEQIDQCKQKLCNDSETGSVSTVSAGDVQRGTVIDNLQEADSLLKAKKRLLGAIMRTNAFSNKYRLFGDYMELLRRELDRDAVKVALTGNGVNGDDNSPDK